MTESIFIAGVGGQGLLLASKILGCVLVGEGYDVKLSEVHGMSQRGGSVVTCVKYGDKVHSPLIEKGEADFFLAFEELEAARWLGYLKTGGRLILNANRIRPMPVITGKAEYPQGIAAAIKATGVDVKALDALALAKKAGSAKAVNTVMIGALAKHLLIGRDKWERAIEALVPEKFKAINLKAFEEGYNCVHTDC